MFVNSDVLAMTLVLPRDVALGLDLDQLRARAIVPVDRKHCLSFARRAVEPVGFSAAKHWTDTSGRQSPGPFDLPGLLASTELTRGQKYLALDRWKTVVEVRLCKCRSASPEDVALHQAIIRARRVMNSPSSWLSPARRPAQFID